MCVRGLCSAVAELGEGFLCEYFLGGCLVYTLTGLLNIRVNAVATGLFVIS